MNASKRKTYHPVFFNQNKQQGKSPICPENKKKQGSKGRLAPSASTTLLVKKNVDFVKNEHDNRRFLNENQDTTNIATKWKNQEKTAINFKKQEIHHSKSKSKSKNPMQKSASMGKLTSKTVRRKSVSPLQNKEDPSIKVKYHSKKSCRTDRQKSKKGKKPSKTTKRQEGQKNVSQKTTRHQSQNLKTEISSKMPSVSKQVEEKKSQQKKGKKKFTKLIKTKDIVHYPERRQKKKISSIKQKIQNSLLFSDENLHEKIEGSFMYSEIVTKQNFYMPISQQDYDPEIKKKTSAAITIQKTFRGYLTRKYIEEIKYMVRSIVKIQKVWRGYTCRKRVKKQLSQKKPKNMLSIQNSLITIKDFSEEQKEQRLKEKHFNFKVNESLETKSIKVDIEDRKNLRKISDAKLVGLLESLLDEEELGQKIKEKIRSSICQNKQRNLNTEFSHEKKKEYIQSRINSQILSEKSFNSPRQLISPKAKIPLNSPASGKINFDHCLQKIPCEMFQSPRKFTDSNIIKRLVSPGQKQEKSYKKSLGSSVEKKEKNEVLPMDTSFSFLQQFCLVIVEIIRDCQNLMNNFMNAVQNSKSFRINLVLKGWDKFCETQTLSDSPVFAMLDFVQMPIIFSSWLKQKILQYPSMKLLLDEGHYLQDKFANKEQENSYQSFKSCIFDAFTECIYNQFRDTFIPFKKQRNFIQTYDTEKLFRHIMLQSILQLRSCCEYFCGIYIPEGCEENPDYNRMRRLELMLKDDEKNPSLDHCESWEMWVKIMFGEIIFQDLVIELEEEFLQTFINK